MPREELASCLAKIELGCHHEPAVFECCLPEQHGGLHVAAIGSRHGPSGMHFLGTVCWTAAVRTI